MWSELAGSVGYMKGDTQENQLIVKSLQLAINQMNRNKNEKEGIDCRDIFVIYDGDIKFLYCDYHNLNGFLFLT